MMFEPDIVWHYSGRLRDLLLNAATPPLVSSILSAPGVVVVPTTAVDLVRKLVREADPGRHFQIDSGTVKAFDGYLKATANPVIWLPARGTQDLEAECRNLERAARKRRRTCTVVPAPGLPVAEVLRVVDEAPSTLLDGTHSSEQRLPERMAALPEPLGSMVSYAWSELQATTDLSLLSGSPFEARLAQLHPSVVEAPLWSTVISLWRAILWGMEENRVEVERWSRAIESQPNSHVGLAELNDVLLHEKSIFGAHALKDPSCLSYPAIVHGHHWGMGRFAVLSLFGSLGLSSPSYGGSAFEAG